MAKVTLLVDTGNETINYTLKNEMVMIAQLEMILILVGNVSSICIIKRARTDICTQILNIEQMVQKRQIL